MKIRHIVVLALFIVINIAVFMALFGNRKPAEEEKAKAESKSRAKAEAKALKEAKEKLKAERCCGNMAWRIVKNNLT